MAHATNRKFEHDLKAYSESVQASGTVQGWRKRAGSWSAYAAAAGSALVLATAAEANTIVYSGQQHLYAPALINIDGQGHSFRLSVRSSDLGDPVSCQDFWSAYLIPPVGGQVLGGTKVIKGLPFGARVSSHVSGFAASNTLLRSHSTSLYCSAQHNGSFGRKGVFAGVKFTQAGQVHYGWIAINFGRNNDPFAISWAYNDVAGAPISAGQIYNDAPGPVPPNSTVSVEPASAALSLLAAGSNGVLAWRRRRQEWREPAAAQPSPRPKTE